MREWARGPPISESVLLHGQRHGVCGGRRRPAARPASIYPIRLWSGAHENLLLNGFGGRARAIPRRLPRMDWRASRSGGRVFDLILSSTATFLQPKRMAGACWDVRARSVGMIPRSLKLGVRRPDWSFSTNYTRFKLDTRSPCRSRDRGHHGETPSPGTFEAHAGQKIHRSFRRSCRLEMATTSSCGNLVGLAVLSAPMNKLAVGTRVWLRHSPLAPRLVVAMDCVRTIGGAADKEPIDTGPT